MRLVGFQLLESESAAMDSGTALYTNGTKRIQVVKDKGQ